MDLDSYAFARMKCLMFLKLNDVELSGCFTNFPKGLRWLSWHRCHLKCMPSDLSLERLVCLEMQYSSLKQLWKGPKFLPALKILNLSHSMSLASSPDFSRMPNLERLILEGCTQLVEVCESIKSAEGLVLLNLKDCKRLRKLPRNLSMLLSLEELDISGCSSLGEFPMGLRNLGSLKQFDASRIDMGALVSPAKGIPNGASFPQFIEVLSLENCQLSNDCFPKDMSNLSLLKKLYLGGNMITSLPECCGSLENLVFLNVDNCSLLQSVVGLPKGYLSYGDTMAKELLGYWSSAGYISWHDCPKLVEIEGYYKRISMRDVERGVIKKLGFMDLEAELDIFNDVEVHKRSGVLSTWVELDKLPGCFNSLSFNIVYKERYPWQYMCNYRVADKPNNVQGLTLAFLFPERLYLYSLWMSIINKTMNKEFTYVFREESNVGRRDKGVVWVWHIKLGKTTLRPGDLLTFRVESNYSNNIPKEFGVMIVYEEEEDDDGADEKKMTQ